MPWKTMMMMMMVKKKKKKKTVCVFFPWLAEAVFGIEI